jgi:hypothetical protein
VNIGEQIELRAAAQIGVEPPGFDGQGSQPHPVLEQLSFAAGGGVHGSNPA